MSRLKALILLATGLMVVLLRRLVGQGDPMASFAEHYASEGILPVLPEEQGALMAGNTCVACGRCNRWAEERGQAPDIMGFVLAGTRSLPDYVAARRDLGEISEETLRGCESVCPTNVPLVRLYRLVSSHAERLARATLGKTNSAA